MPAFNRSAAASSAAASMFEALRAAGPSRADSVQRMQLVANLLDSAFVIPGTRQRVGIDAIIGLVPGIGDLATTLLSSYVIWEARQLGLPKIAIARMLVNLGIHATAGAVPVVGDLFIALFRTNQRNVRIVREYLEGAARQADGAGHVETGRFEAAGDRFRPSPGVIEGTAVRLQG